MFGQITETAHFANDLGLDSLDTVEVVMAIEEVRAYKHIQPDLKDILVKKETDRDCETGIQHRDPGQGCRHNP